MSVERGIRGLVELLDVYVFGVGVEGGGWCEWMRRLGLGFTNPV